MTLDRPELTLHLPTFSTEPTIDPGRVLDQVQTYEALGVDRLVVSDHVVFGETPDDYGDPRRGGRSGGRQPTGPDGAWLEPLTVLGFVAARTSRIRLGTAILLAALRRPVVLAKTLATLDVMSGGRLDIGVGVGWQRQEYEAADLSFADRGPLLDETLDIVRRLWTTDVVDGTYAGARFDRVHQMPKPAQAGGVPIWVSGTANDAVARRVANAGGRWIPWGDDAADPVAGIARMREAVARLGGDPHEVRAAVFCPLVETDGALDVDATLDVVARWWAVGCVDFRMLSRQLGSSLSDAERSEHLRALVAGFAGIGRQR